MWWKVLLYFLILVALNSYIATTLLITIYISFNIYFIYYFPVDQKTFNVT